jgi:hypothetical protein
MGALGSIACFFLRDHCSRSRTMRQCANAPRRKRARRRIIQAANAVATDHFLRDPPIPELSRQALICALMCHTLVADAIFIAHRHIPLPLSDFRIVQIRCPIFDIWAPLFSPLISGGRNAEDACSPREILSTARKIIKTAFRRRDGRGGRATANSGENFRVTRAAAFRFA